MKCCRKNSFHLLKFLINEQFFGNLIFYLGQKWFFNLRTESLKRSEAQRYLSIAKNVILADDYAVSER